LIRQIISYHIVPDENVYTSALAAGATFTSLQGGVLTVTDSGLLNDAAFIALNIKVSNGYDAF